MTTIASLYPFLRALLGDKEVYGVPLYSDAELMSAVRTVFAVGRGPEGFALAGGNSVAAMAAATAIEPDLEGGDALAMLLYEAGILLVTPSDGGFTYRTRSMTVKDEGDRKRDLLWELKRMIREIQGGGVFATRQTVAQWIIATGGYSPAEMTAIYSEISVRSPVESFSV